MIKLSRFERLEESVDLIVRHADYPGKGRVIEQCAEEIEELHHSGEITGDQEAHLLAILRSGFGCRRTA
jgi:hypothetical protein